MGRIRQTVIAGSALLFCAALSVSARAAAPQNPIPPVPDEVAREAPPVFPLEDVERGLEGYGYTVFSSARGPERFGFEVLGVLRGYLGPGEDLIIAKLTGEQIERTGVIAGMSGSPVYVDGKLVGAVGYRFGSFTKEPIAGITPIERMLTAAEEAAGEAAGRPLGPLSPASGSAARGAQTAWGHGEPIAVPIAVSGVHPAVLEGFEEELNARGYGPRVASGGGGGKAEGPPRRFYAGGPIAGTLVDGDMSMSGIGTVTWVSGERFLAFGHPFQGTGRSGMPVSNAEILTTVASQSASWKLGQATVPTGRLTDDRLHAIAGTMGEAPATVDVRFDLDLDGPRAAADAKEQVKLQVMRDGMDSPLFVAIALANTMTNRVGLERGGTVDLEADVTLSTGDTVKVYDRAALEGTPAVFIQVAIGLLGELSRLVDNGLEDVELDKVMVKVRHREDVDAVEVASIDASSALKAGGKGRARVRVIGRERGLKEHHVDLRLPRGLAPGEWRLIAASPHRAVRLMREGGLLGDPLTFDDVIAERAKVPRPGRITLFLVKDAHGLKVGGQGMAGLPRSLHGLLEGGGGLSGTLIENEVVPVATLDTDGVVDGQARAKVWVEGASE